MKYYTGQLIEVLLEVYKNASAKIVLPAEAHPAPGQYLLINQLDSLDEAFPKTFFPAFADEALNHDDHLLISGSIPQNWEPGISLAIRAPLGAALQIPKATQRLGLLAMGPSSVRLLPIFKEALNNSISVALVADQMPANLPDVVEYRDQAQAQKIIQWADYLIIDRPLSQKIELKEQLNALNLSKHTNGMMLFSGAYPCGGLADCGLCSVNVPGKVLFACKGGPAYNIPDLLS